MESILSLLVIVSIFWCLAISVFGLWIYRRFLVVIGDDNKTDIIKALNQIDSTHKKLSNQLKNLEKDLDVVEAEMPLHIQKLGFVRYNPFGNTGGDQSFCLSLLDGRGNGILITSLHARSQTRIYTKEIINHQPKEGTQLSKEEEKCLKTAKSWS